MVISRELSVKQKIKMGFSWEARIIRHILTGEDARAYVNRNVYVMYEYDSYNTDEELMDQEDADYGEWRDWYKQKYELEHGMITTQLPKDWVPDKPYPGKGKWVEEPIVIPKDVEPK